MKVYTSVCGYTHSSPGGPSFVSSASHTATLRVSCRMMSLYFSTSPGFCTCSRPRACVTPIYTSYTADLVIPWLIVIGCLIHKTLNGDQNTQEGLSGSPGRARPGAAMNIVATGTGELAGGTHPRMLRHTFPFW